MNLKTLFYFLARYIVQNGFSLHEHTFSDVPQISSEENNIFTAIFSEEDVFEAIS
jgi:hypothetical protein